MKFSVKNGTATYNGTGQNGGAKIEVSEPKNAVVKYGSSAGACTLSRAPGYVNAGTYTLYYKITAENYKTETGTLTVKIEKAEGSCGNAYSNVTTYDGREHELVVPASSSTGTVYYKLGTNGSYSTSIPVRKNASTYRVYYYSKGDANHLDSDEKLIDVTIGKAKVNGVFSATSFTYNGKHQYPDVQVNTAALLADNEYLVVEIQNPSDNSWSYCADTSYVNPSYSHSNPFKWIVKKDENVSLTCFKNCERGTYTRKYRFYVSTNTPNVGGTNQNYEINEVTYTMTIK